MTKQTPLILLTVALLSNSFSAIGQKLPNKQETSVYAPADIKIDGKSTEWNDKFQAYNHAVEAWYTISNDDNNLYLIFRSNETEVTQKIITGGFVITVSPVDKKSELTPVAMNYPVVPWMSSQVDYLLKPSGPVKDADVKFLNRKINDQLKEIKISGVKSIPDGSISVYNDLGIKGAHLLDNQKNYTCEMVLPLSFIKHLIDDKGTFAYRVQVNGIDLKTTVIVGGRSASDPAAPSSDAVPHGLLYDTSPTYFTATYTLAKKP
ncbi:hypothetical protein HQ865_06570 [Mucilaginibacter mali]|uniref:Uncharacterized protein n=1 Tax=Mucilaginibacter mali TaxID=2740462 RepID=A0A7D4Q6Q1_9SPHI|nr:hypothetical protein [Mucilaginibacter mali]QKJ29431.1 hypothetical protein HQ865_06570 [Mucilaginibacter mali]